MGTVTQNWQEDRTFAQAVRSLREDILRITQTQMGAKIGVNRDAVAKWESGSRQPRPETCRALAKLAAGESLQLTRQDDTSKAEQAGLLAAFFGEAGESSGPKGAAGYYAASALAKAIKDAYQGDVEAKKVTDLLSKRKDDLGAAFQAEASELSKISDPVERKRVADKLLEEWTRVRILQDGLVYFTQRGRAAIRRELGRFDLHAGHIQQIERLIASRFLDQESVPPHGIESGFQKPEATIPHAYVRKSPMSRKKIQRDAKA